MTRDQMIQVAKIILATGKKIGPPHFQSSMPFASFQEIARGLQTEADELGQLLAHNPNLADFKFVNYFGETNNALNGVVLLAWPDLSKKKRSRPRKQQ